MSKINFRNAKFIISLPTLEGRMKDNYKEVVFIGKSNVGKSTLINSLLSQKIAYSSKKAGKTQLLNYFLIDKRFYIVDSPGYGYTSYGSKKDDAFSTMMEGYFEGNSNLKGALLLVDVRRGIKEEEEELIEYIRSLDIPLLLIYTKCDTVGQKEMALAKKEAALYSDIGLFCSGKDADYSSLRALMVKTFAL